MTSTGKQENSKAKRTIKSPDLSKMTRIQVDAKTIKFVNKVKPKKTKRHG